MLQGVKTTLVKLSICECGFSVLDDSIKIGTVYTIYPITMRDQCTLICGGCGKVHKYVSVVDASQKLHPERPPMPLPLEIFDFQEESIA